MKALQPNQMTDQLPTVRPSDCYPGSVHWMSSLDIRFMHDTLKERFRPFSETRRSPFVETSILDTMGELLAGDRPKELDELKVVMLEKSQQIYLTASELLSQEQTMGGVVLRLNIVQLRVREMLLYQRALGSIGMVEIG